MNVNAEPLISLLIQLLLLLTMVSSFSYHLLPFKNAFHHQAYSSHRQPTSSHYQGHASSNVNSRVGKALGVFNSHTGHASSNASSLHPGHATDNATLHTSHTPNTANHHLGHVSSSAISNTSHASTAANALHQGHASQASNHHLGHVSSTVNSHNGHGSATLTSHTGHASSTSPNAIQSGHSSSKPPVWEREQAILGVYHSTIAHVTQTSAKITEISRHILNHSLDIVATNVLRYDQYITEVDTRTQDCKFNSEEQLQRIKDLLQQKLKHKISHCMARVNTRLGTFEKSIKEEMNKYNNVILLQIKNILIICNKMQGDVMNLCLDKSWQISTHVNEKFLASVNGYFGHALLVYNQSNGTLMECLQKDIQANKKFFHWAIKLYRTSTCKHLLKP